MPPTPRTRSTRYLPARTSPSCTPAATLELPCIARPVLRPQNRDRIPEVPAFHCTRRGSKRQAHGVLGGGRRSHADGQLFLGGVSRHCVRPRAARSLHKPQTRGKRG